MAPYSLVIDGKAVDLVVESNGKTTPVTIGSTKNKVIARPYQMPLVRMGAGGVHRVLARREDKLRHGTRILGKDHQRLGAGHAVDQASLRRKRLDHSREEARVALEHVRGHGEDGVLVNHEGARRISVVFYERHCVLGRALLVDG